MGVIVYRGRLGCFSRHRTCTLHVEPDDEAQMRVLLAQSSIMNVKTEAVSPMLVVYDHKLAGESKTNPRQRVPPFKEWHMAKCMRSWVEVRMRHGKNPPTPQSKVATNSFFTTAARLGWSRSIRK